MCHVFSILPSCTVKKPNKIRLRFGSNSSVRMHKKKVHTGASNLSENLGTDHTLYTPLYLFIDTTNPTIYPKVQLASGSLIRTPTTTLAYVATCEKHQLINQNSAARRSMLHTTTGSSALSTVGSLKEERLPAVIL